MVYSFVETKLFSRLVGDYLPHVLRRIKEEMDG